MLQATAVIEETARRIGSEDRCFMPVRMARPRPAAPLTSGQSALVFNADRGVAWFGGRRHPVFPGHIPLDSGGTP